MSITATIDIEKLIRQLPIEKKDTIGAKAGKTTWARRLDNAVNNIRCQIKDIPSEEEITPDMPDVPKKVYARHKSGH